MSTEHINLEDRITYTVLKLVYKEHLAYLQEESLESLVTILKKTMLDINGYKAKFTTTSTKKPTIKKQKVKKGISLDNAPIHWISIDDMYEYSEDIVFSDSYMALRNKATKDVCFAVTAELDDTRKLTSKDIKMLELHHIPYQKSF